jgi:DNA-binding response OmpR family regulator
VHSKGYIVIVEPDDLIRELLQRWLGDAGYSITMGGAGITRPAPKLVIADISIPSTAADTIAALHTTYGAPILVLSARFRRGLGGSVETAYRLQVGRVLPKPFTRGELLAAVSEAIRTS